MPHQVDSPLRGRARPTLGRLALAVYLLALVPTVAGAADESAGSVTGSGWEILQRAVSQDSRGGQAWQIDYRLRNTTGEPAILVPSQITAEVEGWVSNSRAVGHAHPRRSLLHWFMPNSSAECTVVPSRDQANLCRELGTFEVWSEAQGPAPLSADVALARRIAAPMSALVLTIPAEGILCIRLRLAHDHFLYGAYEPLLGPRSLTLRLGNTGLQDEIALDRPTRGIRSAPTWPSLDPPLDRRDNRVFLSPPDSLHLAAHIPGHGYYRMSGPVRYGTSMRLRFWYLMAPGSQTEALARIIQLKQGPALWKPLPDGQKEISLTTIGRWTRVERVFRTEDEATNMTLEFRLTGELGDLWIDDLRMEPLGMTLEGP